MSGSVPNYLSYFKQENIASLFGSITGILTRATKQPIYVLALLAAFLVATNFLGTFLATPFGLGLMAGVFVVLYVLANYGSNKQEVKQKDTQKNS